VNPANAYHVIGETPSVKFMIDTGAAVSLIREDVWTRITEGNVALSPWEGCQLVGAEGSKIEIRGVTTLVFSIAGQKVEGEFLVTTRLNSEAILGLDFLEQNQCIINAEQHTVHLRGVAVAIGTGARKTAFPVEQLCLPALDRLVVPPLSEVEIMAVVQMEGRIANNDLSGHTYLVEAVAGRHPIILPTPLFLPVQLTVPVVVQLCLFDLLIHHQRPLHYTRARR